MNEALLRELCRLAPFESASDARLALISGLEALGFLLPEHLLRELAAALPPACATPLAAGQAVSRSGSYDADAERMLGASGQAVERIQEVYAVLARHLPADLVGDLIRELPEQFAGAFAGGGAHSLPEAERAAHHRGTRHLSDARGDRPNSLARGRPPGAQQDSVAAVNPHGDTKLSSARGLTQEREGEDLAETSSQRTRRDRRP